MSAEVTFALIGVTVGVLALFTYAAFHYVPMALAEEEHEEPSGTVESSEFSGENFAD